MSNPCLRSLLQTGQPLLTPNMRTEHLEQAFQRCLEDNLSKQRQLIQNRSLEPDMVLQDWFVRKRISNHPH